MENSIMNKKVCITCSAIFIAHVGIVPAYAGQDYSKFENVDGNADGYISQSEAQVRKDLQDNWKTIDKDSDGKLDISEFSAFEGEGRLTPPQDPDMGELGAAPYPDPSK
jgi:hypothetical protein